jgi:TPP-dependent trihydroxycyclohexane-1,2-dione (THcHDO) dehydratase
VLTDPAECGPVTLALCQDVQDEALTIRCIFRTGGLDASAHRPGQRNSPPPSRSCAAATKP